MVCSGLADSLTHVCLSVLWVKPPFTLQLAETSKRLQMEHNDRIKSRRQQALPWLPKYKSLPTRIFLVLDDPPSCKLAQVWAVLIMAVIVATAVALCVESLPKFRIQVRMFVGLWCTHRVAASVATQLNECSSLLSD